MTTQDSTSPFMTYRRLAVIGAAGKMGTGISLLLLQEMAVCKLRQACEKDHREHYRLVLIDTDRNGLEGLRSYLLKQLRRFAEKNIISLRKAVSELPSLISNREIIDFFLAGAMEIVHFATSLEEAKDARLIFEAIVENIEKKVALFSALKSLSSEDPYFFSNTSSIPISVLNARANLDGKIIGFHFYNPPAVQKLLEIIPLENGNKELKLLAIELAKSLKKTVIFSEDIAGFIGNGYFLREVAFAFAMTRKLAETHGMPQSIYMIDKVTQDFLLRPMGIYRLIDYVGLDVVAGIGEILNHHLQKPFYDNTPLEPLLKAGKYGGQFSDGSQKEGFFRYSHGNRIEIFDVKANAYETIDHAGWKKSADAWLGNPPENLTWKALEGNRNADKAIENYFRLLREEKTEGSKIAFEFIENLRNILKGIVQDKIAGNKEDVVTVLKKGFFHLYDPSITGKQ